MCAQSIQIKKMEGIQKACQQRREGLRSEGAIVSRVSAIVSFLSVKEISESSQYCVNANFHFPYL